MKHVRELLARDAADLTAVERARIDEHVARCAECRSLRAELARSDQLLRTREAHVSVPRFEAVPHARERVMPFALGAAAVVAILAAVVLAPILASMPDRAAQPSSAGSPTVAPATSAPPTPQVASPRPSPAATATPGRAPLPPGTFENETLGYRITLGPSYRIFRSSINTRGGEILGGETFTTMTEAQWQEECQQDAGHIPGPSIRSFLSIAVYRERPGTTAFDWASSSPFKSPRATVQRTTINGLDAAQFVEDGQITGYAIHANARIYMIHLQTWPTDHPLQQIANTFQRIEPRSFPSATPTSDPRQGASQVAAALSKAFAERDADTIARYLPECWLAAVPRFDGATLGGGHINRSVYLFMQGLRERFARGDLSVAVATELESRSEGGRELFAVRSDWKYPDRTIRIDMVLAEADGRWHWQTAEHHFTRGEMGCIPYRSPWVSGTGSC